MCSLMGYDIVMENGHPTIEPHSCDREVCRGGKEFWAACRTISRWYKIQADEWKKGQTRVARYYLKGEAFDPR